MIYVTGSLVYSVPGLIYAVWTHGQIRKYPELRNRLEKMEFATNGWLSINVFLVLIIISWPVFAVMTHKPWWIDGTP